MTWKSLDWYDAPRWYDMVFDLGTETEADFLDTVARRWGPPRGRRLLEPACGSGRLLTAMGRRGWTVTGTDGNPTMVAYARERLARAHLPGQVLQDDLSRFEVKRPVHLAFCLVSTFKYLLDEQAARDHLHSVARALVPGGVYVLGLHLTDYDEQSRVRERWVANRGGTEVVCNIQTWPPLRRPRTEQVRSRLRVRRADLPEERLETVWTFRTYDARQLRRLLATVPELELVAVHDFHHDAASTSSLDDEHLDKVLVLRRRHHRARGTP